MEEGSGGDELDLDGEAVLDKSGVVETEFEGGVVVPFGVGAAADRNACAELLLLLLGTAGDRNEGVDVHRGVVVDVLDVVSRQQRYF